VFYIIYPGMVTYKLETHPRKMRQCLKGDKCK